MFGVWWVNENIKIDRDSSTVTRPTSMHKSGTGSNPAEAGRYEKLVESERAGDLSGRSMSQARVGSDREEREARRHDNTPRIRHQRAPRLVSTRTDHWSVAGSSSAGREHYSRSCAIRRAQVHSMGRISVRARIRSDHGASSKAAVRCARWSAERADDRSWAGRRVC